MILDLIYQLSMSKNLVKFLKIKMYKLSNVSFKMVSSYVAVCGIAEIKLKIFNK